jgi:hypothetical protein
VTKKADETENMISAEEGVQLYAEAGLSENTFYRHAREKKIRKTLPGDRERGALYSKQDIKKIIEYQKIKSRKRSEAIRTSKEDGSKTDWFNENDLPYLLVLDYQMYGISESLDLSISYGWWSKNPKICRILYNRWDRKDIWGYITMIPMVEETIFKLLRREMHERDIKPELILPYENQKQYTIYAASVVIRPEHQTHLRGLIKSILNYWCNQCLNCRISKIYAYADSKEEWHLIRHLYFAPRYDIGKKAFELDLRQPNPSKLVTSFQDCLRERERVSSGREES